MAIFSAPLTIRAVVWVAAAIASGVVTFTASAGLVNSIPLAALAGIAAAAGTVAWLRRQPIEDAAALAPRAVRLAFVVGTALVVVQLAWLIPFIIDPNRTTWGPGPTAPLPSSHSCVSAYWIADAAVSRVPDIYSESLSSIPQPDPRAQRVPRTMGPFNIDAFEYPPTFLLLPRVVALATPDFWRFRRLWFALNFAAVVAIAIVIARRLDRVAGTHAVWLTPYVIAAPPIISTFQVGNVQMAIIAVSVLAMLLFERRAYALGGFILAYVIAAKMYPGVLVVYLLLRRDWRAVMWTAAASAALVAVSVVVFGWTPMAAFIDHAPKLMSGEAFPAFRNPLAIANNGSVPGLVFKLPLFGVPHTGFTGMRTVGWLYTLVVIAGTAWLALRARPEGREPIVWLAILVLATMRSPFLPTYASFPSLWLATFLAALAWRDARPVAPIVACWVLLSIGFGPGGMPQVWNAAWTTMQTVLAFVVLAWAFRQVRASRAGRLRPAGLTATLALIAICVVTAACGERRPSPPAPGGIMAPVAQAYLNEVIALMEAHSVNRLKIDWSSFRTGVMSAAGAAQSVGGTFPAIQVALNLLGDSHSFYQPLSGLRIAATRRACVGQAAGVPTLPSTVGYVKVGAFSGSPDEATAFANALQRAVAGADRDALAGWIVDVRGNGGGNMWPMIAGVGPILGEGPAGYFIDPVGAESVWEYRDGASWENGAPAQRVDAPYQLRRGSPKVAVLVDGGTASSGEAVAIAFRRRPDTRSFGAVTCGLSTSNEEYRLSDGASLYLTNAVMADRSKFQYGGPIAPDEELTDPREAEQRAVAWLRDP